MAWALVVLKSSLVHSGVGRALKATGFNAFHSHTQGLGNYVTQHGSMSLLRSACERRIQFYIIRWPCCHSAHCCWAPLAQFGNNGSLCSLPRTPGIQGRGSHQVWCWGACWCLCRSCEETVVQLLSTLASWAIDHNILWVSIKMIMLQSSKKPKPSPSRGSCRE